MLNFKSKNRPGEMIWSLELRAPDLDDYSVEIVSVTHSVPIYPALVASHNSVPLRCEDEAELIRRLRDVFQSARTKQVIQALLIQGQ